MSTSPITLRPYQAAAVDAVYDYLRQHDGNPVVVSPTGSGKSVLIGKIASDAVTLWNGRVLVVTHVRELIEQNADKIRKLCPHIPVGIYSASLRRRDTNQPIICAGIQSIYQRACDLGGFDLILVDEAHLISDRDNSMYGQFLSDMKVISPHCRIIGATATAFRLDSGSICGPERMFQDICYEIGIRELIIGGYLCPLISKAGQVKVDTSQLHVRGGEFIAGEVEELMDGDDLVASACQEIVELTRDRQAVLIFAAGLRHARHIQTILQEQHNLECGFVCGETPIPERDELLARFRGDPADGLFERPPLKYLANFGVLTTGFDCPRLDAIAILRPTMSPGLLVQMVGRGFRLHPGKQDCLVLDYGGNIQRHGPIDQIKPVERKGNGTGPAPAKECPECHSVIAAGYAACPDCGFEFPPPERQTHESKATNAGILSDQYTDQTFDVLDIRYLVHQKRNAPEEAPRTMRVEYRLGLNDWQSEFICFEHTGYARQKAVAWWTWRSPDPVPATAEEAVALANAGAVAVTHAVTVRSIPGEPFDRIIDYELGPRPEPVLRDPSFDPEEVPF